MDYEYLFLAVISAIPCINMSLHYSHRELFADKAMGYFIFVAGLAIVCMNCAAFMSQT